MSSVFQTEEIFFSLLPSPTSFLVERIGWTMMIPTNRQRLGKMAFIICAAVVAVDVDAFSKPREHILPVHVIVHSAINNWLWKRWNIHSRHTMKLPYNSMATWHFCPFWVLTMVDCAFVRCSVPMRASFFQFIFSFFCFNSLYLDAFN